MEITQTQAGLVVHAAQMGGFLVGGWFSPNEQAAMDGLIADGICEHIAEPGQVAFFRLTDVGQQVAEGLGAPF